MPAIRLVNFSDPQMGHNDARLLITVIPQDDGLMDFWISGLLGLSSKKTIDSGF
jgi:hypothetical protein